MPFIESFLEFKERMNCEFISVNKRYLFDNGGQSDGTTSHMDPPTDKWERLYLKREFLTAVIADETKAWSDFKTHCAEQLRMKLTYPDSVPDVGPDAVAQLERGRDNIRRLHRELEGVRELLSKAPGEQAKRREASVGNIVRDRVQEQAAKILGMEL